MYCIWIFFLRLKAGGFTNKFTAKMMRTFASKAVAASAAALLYKKKMDYFTSHHQQDQTTMMVPTMMGPKTKMVSTMMKARFAYCVDEVLTECCGVALPVGGTCGGCGREAVKLERNERNHDPCPSRDVEGGVELLARRGSSHEALAVVNLGHPDLLRDGKFAFTLFHHRGVLAPLCGARELEDIRLAKLIIPYLRVSSARQAQAGHYGLDTQCGSRLTAILMLGR